MVGPRERNLQKARGCDLVLAAAETDSWCAGRSRGEGRKVLRRRGMLGRGRYEARGGLKVYRLLNRCLPSVNSSSSPEPFYRPLQTPPLVQEATRHNPSPTPSPPSRPCPTCPQPGYSRRSCRRTSTLRSPITEPQLPSSKDGRRWRER